MRLKPVPTGSKLQSIQATLNSLNQSNDRWKTIKLIIKQQATESATKQHSQHPSTEDGLSPAPVWTQRMDTLFGPPDDQLRLIKCENCGILTRETNGKVGVTHKLNCEMLRKSGISLGKKLGPLAGIDSGSKKRASSEVSLDSSNLPVKKKKATIIDHTIPESERNAPKGMTKKELKKAIAAAERLEREKERKEKKLREEEAKKASKKMGRIKGGPVNVNEQCGVLIPPNDTPCARSLTCKTHSMGAKRSVPGRSAPYDVLLNEWQKKNNPNWGDRKVVTPRVGPGIEPGVSKKKKKEVGNGSNNINNLQKNPNNNDQSLSQSNGNSQPKQNQSKEKSSSNSSHKLKSQKNSSGGHNGGHSSSSKRKDPNHHSHKADSKIPNEKLSAANEAKLLGETDDDFYLIVPPPKRRKKDQQGDVIMEIVEERGKQEEIEELEEESPSDQEVDLIINSLLVSQGGKALVDQAMGSAWLHPQWSKFGKLGVRESFRDAFRGKA